MGTEFRSKPAGTSNRFGPCRHVQPRLTPPLSSTPPFPAIQAKLDAGEKPTPQIISLILKDQTNKAQGLLRKDSSLVCHQICVNAFATVGWNFDKNAGYVFTHRGVGDRVDACAPSNFDFHLFNDRACITKIDLQNSVGETPPDIDRVQNMLRAAAAKIRSTLTERHASIAPTPEELKDLSLACGRLWCAFCVFVFCVSAWFGGGRGGWILQSSQC